RLPDARLRGALPDARRRRRGQHVQGLLVGAGRGAHRDRARPARPGRRTGRPLAGGARVRPGRADLRGHQRDPAQRGGRARPRPPPGGKGRQVRFTLASEQRLFAETVRDLLSGADVCGAARAWGRGDHAPGRALWRALADAGVLALAVPEEHGGAGVRPVELVAALIEIGRHGVPGPVVETLAAARVLGDAGDLAGIAGGSRTATLAVPPEVPYALDADAADLVLAVHDGALHRAEPAGEPHRSLDPARRLFSWSPGGRAASAAGSPARVAAEFGALACAAQALGAGRRLLDATVAHVRTREQFGRPV